jgi:hypothetical protein
MRVTVFIVTISAATLSYATIADDPPQRSAELQVLDRFVGIWDVVVTTKVTGGGASTEKSVETRKWSSGGNVLHFEASAKQNPESHLLVTHDAATGSYPGVLIAGPSRAVLTGSWDEPSQTMTFRGVFADGGGRFTFKNKFIDTRTIETSGVITDREGKVLMEQTHKQTRRNK